MEFVNYSFFRKWTFWLGVVVFVSTLFTLTPGNAFSVKLFSGSWMMTLGECVVGLGFVIEAIYSSQKSK
ncbi:hypothetical protein ABN16_06840 [Levilactobacillus koreensis]|uniref:Uncharacterized protein n=1 Tax=Levilactobacillus koreensis TaxID=637971 RepID=A0AAC8ZGG5_9LACO|nr:hypothetical protein ABN16_06840 [Levilactobacillus koreensis]